MKISQSSRAGKEKYDLPGYDDAFYKERLTGSRQSADEVVPHLMELIRPRSVVDLGCGLGTWLSVFRKHGVDVILGVDGEWVDKRSLEIPEDRFQRSDLAHSIRVTGTFDLAVSLEVAEHLPQESAAQFVSALVGLSPVVLFSAAIPFQGGTNHVNEQWPDYWVSLFRARNYLLVDCLRPRIWDNPNVDFWYAQNLLVFVSESHLHSYPLLERELQNHAARQLCIVHPRQYMCTASKNAELKDIFESLANARQEIAAFIPPEDKFIFVDQEEFAGILTAGRSAVPFLERDGKYWGLPPDDFTAVQEMERLRRSGASFIVFAWPAFWWLQHYSGLYRHLRSEYRCVLESDRLLIFDLQNRELSV